MLVIKCGTEVLLDEQGSLNQGIFDRIAGQAAEIQSRGQAVAIVSSGAIKAGREYMNILQKDPAGMIKKQLSGSGMADLFHYWKLAFAQHGKGVIMVLVTYANLSNSQERENTRRAILDCQQLGIVPIINENDLISDEEIRQMEQGISENDRLAAMVADLVNASAVLFLTQSGGVYEADPAVNPEARMYAEIDFPAALALIESNSGKSPNGSGGIAAKLKAAVDCYQAGRRVAIARLGSKTITWFAEGGTVGTMFGTAVKFRD